MCGIFGVVKPRKDIVKATDLKDSLRQLAHRGPDGNGIYLYENVGLGHQRLAVFDTSEKGQQPMTAWNLTIVFNGAIYNFPELRQELEAGGYSFSSQTDTEVILAAYHKWGKDCVQKFNGQWAFAIHDKSAKLLFCSRDRFGIKPFYYTWIQSNFYLASEIKAFLPAPGWRAKLNHNRAYEYLAHQMHDHTTETFFEDVFALEKGHHLILNLESGKYIKERYYSLDTIRPIAISAAEAEQQFRDLFENSIRLRLRADVPMGAALSGGLDSSALVLSIPKVANVHSINTFSIVYDEPRISERKYLDAVLASKFLNPSLLSPTLSDFKEITSKLLWQQEEPFNGFGVYAQHLIFKAASEKGIKVMLNGQGADEILGGYEKFLFIALSNKINSPLSFLKLCYQIHSKHRFDYVDGIQQLRQYLSKGNNRQPDWLRLAVDPGRSFQRAKEQSIVEASKNLINGLGLGALLRYEDKNAMAFGIESRVPYLDHQLVEYCLSLPDELKINNGIRKWILRESMKDRLPEVIYKRHDKLGFATPQQSWLKAQRSTYLKEIDDNYHWLENIINPKYKDSKLEDLTIWRIHLFSKWLDRFGVEV